MREGGERLGGRRERGKEVIEMEGGEREGRRKREEGEREKKVIMSL